MRKLKSEGKNEIMIVPFSGVSRYENVIAYRHAENIKFIVLSVCPLYRYGLCRGYNNKNIVQVYILM